VAEGRREVAPEKPPLQLELESFGITPARAKALVEAHSETHVRSRIDYVRGLMERRPGQSGRTGGARTTVKNPAGLLARAIEQSYVVPEPVQRAAPARRAEPATEPPHESAAVARGLVPRLDAASSATADAPAAATLADHTSAGADDVSPDHPLWTPLSAALKDRLSPATYAAWIAPARPQPAATDAGNVADEDQSRRTLTLIVPNAFALDRWHRPPIAPALQEAAAALNVEVTLQTA
jgi:hypothetical protein